MTAAAPRPTREQDERLTLDWAESFVENTHPRSPSRVLLAALNMARGALTAVHELLDRTLANDPLCTCGWSKPCECSIWTPAVAIDDVRRALDAAPLPAVPDGEDDEVRCECGHIDTDHPGDPEIGWGACITCPCRAFQQAEEAAPAADGEDVPARLDAAADALEAGQYYGLANDLRDAAMVLRERGTAEVRAAVAAALARTPEAAP